MSDKVDCQSKLFVLIRSVNKLKENVGNLQRNGLCIVLLFIVYVSNVGTRFIVFKESLYILE